VRDQTRTEHFNIAALIPPFSRSPLGRRCAAGHHGGHHEETDGR
jgi:hypothetical protein